MSRLYLWGFCAAEIKGPYQGGGMIVSFRIYLIKNHHVDKNIENRSEFDRINEKSSAVFSRPY